MAQTPNQISCLLIPVKDRQLLLPNASVAEIVDFQQPEKTTGSPEWFLGYIRWRGIRLPVISYDAANDQGAAPAPSQQARIAVTNTIGEHHGNLPFIAFVTEGLPRLMKVTKEEITERDEVALSFADQAAVRISGEEAFIPKLEKLEELAVKAVSSY
ncbi:chemotaxis protein CheW [Hahella sp. CCB-MM4]|uniref:chemotaxis protein CheW n=1 Tax=Hahella sp. (strain CCB-MM4) TaxID=1926491 RepID=UPI000B9C1A02|nr:chemotaxis protein CheW [Hahella sp. CCB-MM4]OZG75155.1 chemotaxis protein CheW [Hahella sp. CCB-MM4]